MAVGFPQSTSYANGDVLTATNVNDITGTLNMVGNLIENVQTGTTYTLVAGDAAEVVSMNNASANTLTVPTNASVAFPVGTQIIIYQKGAGQTTINPVSGTVTIRSQGNKLKLAGQYAVAAIWKIATDEWVAFGNLSA